MPRAKISIIGAGSVGLATAHWIASKDLADVVLVDVVEGLPQGKALDLLQSGPIGGFNIEIRGTNSYEDTQNSDVVAITAGFPRKPEMTRDDLVAINTKIVKEVAMSAAKYSPNAILIVVTNPVDAMVYVAAKASSFPKQRVIGMGGVLDSARFKTLIAKELDVSFEDVDAIVIGAHGDSMVPLPRYAAINGIPISEFLPESRLKELAERTRKGSQEIFNLLKTGVTCYAPSAAIVEMIETILKDKKRILPCSAYCDSEYNVNGYFIGAPVKLGKNGVEQIIELKLTDEEKEAFGNSVENAKQLVAMADKFF